MSHPTDPKLYQKIKERVYRDIPTHSAYRSGILVQRYKSAFYKKYGKRKQPYRGKKQIVQSGLKRWFAEESEGRSRI